MAFELETPTSAKLVDVIVLSDKDRAPETNPGAGLDFAMTVGNDVLTMFDGFLRGLLYTKNASSSAPAQGTLDGVAPVSDMPNLTEIGKKLGASPGTWSSPATRSPAMLTPQFLLPIHRELVIDLFAGGGGASTGIELAIGRPVDIAINHDPEAVALHQANHPQTLHYVSDVFEVDPPRCATAGRSACCGPARTASTSARPRAASR
jgi:hypothetical protein